MPCLSNVESFLISSHLIASQLLLEIAHCIPLSPQSVSSHLISTHLMPSDFFHLISSHPIWCLLSHFSALLSWSQLFSSLHMSPELFSSLLISSQLLSGFQIFTAFLNSSQLSAAHVSSSFAFSSLLSSSHIFWALLTSIQLISALVSSSHLISALLSALSNHLTFSLAQNLLQKPIPAPTQATPTLSTGKNWHREAFTHSKLLHREACTRRILHRVREAFIHSKLLHKASFCTQQAFTQKILHAEAFTQRSL